MIHQMFLGISQQYGENIVQNGTFSSSTGWIVPDDWVIFEGNAIHSAGIGVLSQILEDISTRDYELTFTVEELSGSGGVYATFAGTTGTTRTSPGTYTEILNGSPGDTSIAFNPTNSTVTFTLDNVILRRKYY